MIGVVVRELPAARLLALWDEGEALPPAERALVLAAAADRPAGSDPGRTDTSPAPGPDPGREALGALPVGRVTARLLRLRTALFGPEMTATVACPGCGGTVEFSAGAGDLLDLEDKTVDRPPPLLHGGYAVEWRGPSYHDLAAVARLTDAGRGPQEGAALLLDRCVTGVRRPDGTAATGRDLPEPVREALSEAMAQADPLADVLVDLVCPDCALEFTTALDVAAFVWAEVGSRARRLLLDVDALARAYGWSEAEVLALTGPRRAAYLRIVTEDAP